MSAVAATAKGKSLEGSSLGQVSVLLRPVLAMTSRIAAFQMNRRGLNLVPQMTIPDGRRLAVLAELAAAAVLFSLKR